MKLNATRCKIARRLQAMLYRMWQALRTAFPCVIPGIPTVWAAVKVYSIMLLPCHASLSVFSAAPYTHFTEPMHQRHVSFTAPTPSSMTLSISSRPGQQISGFATIKHIHLTQYLLSTLALSTTYMRTDVVDSSMAFQTAVLTRQPSCNGQVVRSQLQFRQRRIA